MKRVILDTNIYGKIIREGDTEFVTDRLEKSDVIIYGCEAIRKEMLKMSKGKLEFVKGKARKLRPLILGLYGLLVKSHEISVTKEIIDLSEAYFVSYRTAGGSISKDRIMTDLIIRGEKTPNFRSYGDFKNDIN